MEYSESRLQNYTKNLFQNQTCLSYLNSRGLNEEFIRKYQLGYFDDNKFSAFNERLLFPVLDQNGEFLTIQGRAMYDWKQETTHPRNKKYYHARLDNKSHMFYGLNEAAKDIIDQGYVVVVEGPFDSIILHQNGIPSVAVLGSTFSVKQAILLRRYTEKVVVWFDGDGAGCKATQNAARVLLKYGFVVRGVVNSAAKDPNETFIEQGKNGLFLELKNAVRFS